MVAALFRDFIEVLAGIFLLLLLTAPVAIAAPLDNWHIRNSPIQKQLYDVAYGNNAFVAVGNNGAILTSTDGITWIDRSVSGVSNIEGIVYGNNIFVAVGWEGLILTSPDGTTWTSRTSGVSSALNDVTYAGSIFVAVGGDGTILSSSDGINWMNANSGTTDSLISVTFGKNTFVAVGGKASLSSSWNRTIVNSPDGTNWSQTYSSSGSIMEAVAYGSNEFVAVDSDGTFFVSSDGASWTPTSERGSENLNGIAYAAKTFVAVGSAGTILTSTNGEHWVSRALGTSESMSGIAFGYNTFVVVGYGYIPDDPSNPFGGGTPTNIILQSDAFWPLVIQNPPVQQAFEYAGILSPVLSWTPADTKPTGVGSVASGGDTLSIKIGLNQFAGPVDVYLALYFPAITPDIYLLTEDSLQPLSSGIVPWKQNITGPIDEPLFGELSVSGLGLPPGIYYLGLLVTPAGLSNLSAYYFWVTDFEVGQPPSVNPPSNLTAAAVSSSQINLSWQDNSTNEDGFRIYRKTGQAGTYSQIATAGPGVTSFSDYGLSQGTTYYYEVSSFNATSESSYSNEASATTLTPTPGLPVSGPWSGSADFGTFTFDVNSAGTGITKVTISYSNYHCGIVVSNLTFSRSYSSAVPITNNTLALNDIDGELTLTGNFTSSTTATGTFTTNVNGTTCSGNWTAAK